MTVTAIVACLILVLPGVPVAYCLGLRGLTAWGSAPLFAGFVVGVGALAAGFTPVHFSIWVVVASTVVCTGVAYGISRLAGRWRGPRTPAVGRVRWWVAGAVAVCGLAAIAMQIRRTCLSIADPSHIGQAYDTLFHLSSVRMILDTGDASTIHMTLVAPGTTTRFYPALWHEFTALVVQLTGVGIPEAANVTTITITTVVWVLSLLALARVLFGPRPALLALVAGLAFTMTQFPNRIMAWGILYPNILALVYLPAVIALCWLALWRARGRGRAAPLAGAAAGSVSLVIAQPNALFALAYILVPMLIHYACHLSWRWRRRPRAAARIAAVWAVLVVGCVGTYVLAGQLSLIASFRKADNWPTILTLKQAVIATGDLSITHIGSVPNNLVAGLIVVGGIVCLFVSRLRWLTFSYGVLAGLTIVCAALPNVTLRSELTGYWYCDPRRLAAQLPVLGVPLAAVGAGALLYLLAGLLKHFFARDARRNRAVAATSIGAVLISAYFVGWFPREQTVRLSFEDIQRVYKVNPEPVDDGSLLDQDELDLIARIPDLVPEGSVVANDPWDGSSFIYPLANRDVLYPAISSYGSAPDRSFIVHHLNEAKTDPAVCAAVKREGVDYVFDSSDFVMARKKLDYFDGLKGLEEAGLVELVASEGQARLYRLTACD